MEKDIEIKDGHKTSEFWVTFLVSLSSIILTMLVAKNMLSEQDSDLLMELITLVVTSLVPVLAYTNSRTRVKEAAYRAGYGVSYSKSTGGDDSSGTTVHVEGSDIGNVSGRDTKTN